MDLSGLSEHLQMTHHKDKEPKGQYSNNDGRPDIVGFEDGSGSYINLDVSGSTLGVVISFPKQSKKQQQSEQKTFNTGTNVIEQEILPIVLH